LESYTYTIGGKNVTQGLLVSDKFYGVIRWGFPKREYQTGELYSQLSDMYAAH